MEHQGPEEHVTSSQREKTNPLQRNDSYSDSWSQKPEDWKNIYKELREALASLARWMEHQPAN